MSAWRLVLAVVGGILLLVSLVGLALFVPAPPQAGVTGTPSTLILNAPEPGFLLMVIPPVGMTGTPYHPTPLVTPGISSAALSMHVDASWQPHVWPGEESQVVVTLNAGMGTETTSPGRLVSPIKSISAPRNSQGIAFVQAVARNGVLAISNPQQFFDGQNARLPLVWQMSLPTTQPGVTTDFQLQLVVRWQAPSGNNLLITPDQVVWFSPLLSTTTNSVPKSLPVGLSVLAFPSGLGLLIAALRGRPATNPPPELLVDQPLKETPEEREISPPVVEAIAGLSPEDERASPPAEEMGQSFAFCTCRWREGDADAPLRVGMTHVLQVAVRAHLPQGTLATAPIDLGTTGPVRLRVVVRAQEMDVQPRVQMLDVPESRNSDWIDFAVTPRQAGQWQIQIEFFYQLNWLQTLEFNVPVSQAQEVEHVPNH